MLEHEFSDFLALCSEVKSAKAISTRLSKGRAVEKNTEYLWTISPQVIKQ